MSEHKPYQSCSWSYTFDHRLAIKAVFWSWSHTMYKANTKIVKLRMILLIDKIPSVTIISFYFRRIIN